MKRFSTFAVLVVVWACSSGGSGGTTGSTSAEQFADAYADGVCGAFERCCAERQLAFDGQTCRTTIRDAVAPILSALGPKQQFDSASADECLSLLSSVACSGEKPNSDACERFINGTLQPGAICADDSECYQDAAAIGARCRDGVCKRITRVAVGGSCAVDATTEPQCESRSFCKDDVCNAPQPAGAACAESRECDSFSCTAGACDPRTPDGGPCGLADCESDRCDTTTQTCVAREPNGGACSNGGDCVSEACVDGVCAPERVVGTAKACSGDIDF